MLLDVFYFIIDLWGMVFDFMTKIEILPGINLLVFNLSLLVIPLIITFLKLTTNEISSIYEDDVNFLRLKKREENYRFRRNVENIRNAKHTYQPKHNSEVYYPKHSNRY